MPDLILLAEDNETDVLLVRRSLRQAGVAASMEIVPDGDHAIAYLAGRPPYADRTRYPLPVLLLLDLKMPRRSGFDVLDWLRNESGLRRLPTVVFTNSSEVSDVNRAFDLGANSYLVKPVNAASLSDVLRLVDRYWLVTNQRPEIAPPA